MADTLYGPRHLMAGFEVLANAEVGAVAFGPFNPGQCVKRLEVLVAWGTSGAIAAQVHNVFVDYRFTAGMPKTVAEALLGRSPFPSPATIDTSKPRVTLGLSEASSAAIFPVEWEATDAERYFIVLVSTDDANEGFSCNLAIFTEDELDEELLL